ncbi:hypothetical protein JB92DRAFT_2829452 [Gautieria morchelliformis]|nr:hypothetical protein JB92DRAFT_2829452 [Gautieria morchelliformis]
MASVTLHVRRISPRAFMHLISPSSERDGAAQQTPPIMHQVASFSYEGDDLSELDKVKMKQISFDGWPVSLAWREELDAMKHTHDINLLPAYDLDHTMIVPKDYERCLLGAAVELHVR